MTNSTSEQYRVVADRDKGDDPQWTDIVDGDRVLYVSGSKLAMARIDRIERPVLTTHEPVHDATPEEIAASLLPPCGFDTEAYAQAFNDGFDAAVAQQLQDEPAAFAVALRAAADHIEAQR